MWLVTRYLISQRAEDFFLLREMESEDSLEAIEDALEFAT
jgi:hypothetical protein